jgi:glycosyltransferase involved in cell wall biosynthesis
MQPEVSIVMCTYNGALYIEEQILSIMEQTYPVSEILIFDDCSSDDTAKIVQKLIEQFPAIRLYVNMQNIGYNKNFEQAIKAAKHNIVAIADQDDIWVKNKIEILLQQWKPRVPLIYSASCVFDQIVPVHAIPSKTINYFSGTNGRRLFVHNNISGHTMLVRKELLHVATAFPPSVFYDWYLAVVASYNGGVQYVDQVLVFQRHHASNATLPQYKGTRKEEMEKYKSIIIKNCTAFANVSGISKKDKYFANQIVRLLIRQKAEHFSVQVFAFFMRHRFTIFSYKATPLRLLMYHIRDSARYAQL